MDIALFLSRRLQVVAATLLLLMAARVAGEALAAPQPVLSVRAALR